MIVDLRPPNTSLQSDQKCLNCNSLSILVHSPALHPWLLVLLSSVVAALSVLGGSWRLGSDWLGANPVTKSIPSPASGLLTGRGHLQRHLWDRL